MKKMRNIMLIFMLVVGGGLILLGVLFNHYSSAVGGDEKVEVTIDSGSTSIKIGEILKEKDLIRSTGFFKIYLKLYGINDLKAGKYELNKNMNLKEILDVLQKGNNYNENEITLTFQEGINMRKIASIISNNTDNTEDDVYKLLKDQEYLKKLINEYWFITDDILNTDIYYSLEGYLYPDTYRFSSASVSVQEIFYKLLKKMDSVLSPYKEQIEKSEMEVRDKDDYREKVISVFVNRLKRGMSLGSDVTTRYAIKLDEKRALKVSEYNSVNAYNTRSSTMAGKLPAGPIGMVSSSSILASINYTETDYLYFIANINTGETFFYTNSSDFEKKKSELASVNKGY